RLIGKTPQEASVKYYQRYINKSFSAIQLKENDFFFRIQKVLFIGRVLSRTKFFNFIDHLTGTISRIFGNAVGEIQTRSGKLKVLTKNSQVMANMKGKL